jgi:hypothetical protein
MTSATAISALGHGEAERAHPWAVAAASSGVAGFLNVAP